MFKDFADYVRRIGTPEQAKVDVVTKMLKEGVDIVRTISSVIPEDNREMIDSAFTDFLNAYYKLNYYNKPGGNSKEKKISIHNVETAVIAFAKKEVIQPSEMKILAGPILKATCVDKDNPALPIMEALLVDQVIVAQRPPDVMSKESLKERFQKGAENWRNRR